MTAVLCGLASFVCLTDANEEALLLARENIEANELKNGVASAFPHWWETSLNAEAESCNVLLGSDVIYDPELFPALCQTIIQFLRVKGRMLLLFVLLCEVWRLGAALRRKQSKLEFKSKSICCHAKARGTFPNLCKKIQ